MKIVFLVCQFGINFWFLVKSGNAEILNFEANCFLLFMFCYVYSAACSNFVDLELMERKSELLLDYYKEICGLKRFNFLFINIVGLYNETICIQNPTIMCFKHWLDLFLLYCYISYFEFVFCKINLYLIQTHIQKNFFFKLLHKNVISSQYLHSDCIVTF